MHFSLAFTHHTPLCLHTTLHPIKYSLKQIVLSHYYYRPHPLQTKQQWPAPSPLFVPLSPQLCQRFDHTDASTTLRTRLLQARPSTALIAMPRPPSMRWSIGTLPPTDSAASCHCHRLHPSPFSPSSELLCSPAHNIFTQPYLLLTFSRGHQSSNRHLNKNNTLGGGFDGGCDATTYYATTIIFSYSHERHGGFLTKLL